MITTQTLTLCQDLWQLSICCNDAWKETAEVRYLTWVEQHHPSFSLRCRFEVNMVRCGPIISHWWDTPQGDTKEQHWRRSTALSGFLVDFLFVDRGNCATRSWVKWIWSVRGRQRGPKAAEGRGEKLEWLWSLEVLWRIRTSVFNSFNCPKIELFWFCHSQALPSSGQNWWEIFSYCLFFCCNLS